MKLKDLPPGAKFRGNDGHGRTWIKGREWAADPDFHGSGQPIFSSGGFLCDWVGNRCGLSLMDIWYPDAEVEPAD